MRLVICDSQRIFAEVLAVTTTVAGGLAAVDAGRPDVCLVDLQFGDEPGGLEAARAIRQRHQGTRVLVLSGVTDPETLPEVMGGGVAGFIRKDQSVNQIAAALEAIAAGGNVLTRHCCGPAPAAEPGFS